MNKRELIAAVAEKADVSKKEAEAVVKATFETITACKVPAFKAGAGLKEAVNTKKKASKKK